ncbi:MAG: hypothetical protein JJU05_09110 [Verrucomicrobia bacterium]|nr:hypothetical protein [Verrucomicrobiota bacterium]MCH8527631.1 hypothetical protein [Kiritimatiellia bacterium]
MTHFSIGFSVFFLLCAGSLPVQAAEPFTAGLEFSGTPGRITLDSSATLAGWDFTVEAWVWLNASGGDRPVLAQIGSEGLFHLLVRNDRLHLGFWGDDLTGSTPVPTGEWVHVAYSYEAATRTQRVFLNGVADGERVAAAQFAENNLPLQIGGFFEPGANPFDGRMLELRIWDHARSAETIAAERFTTPAVDAPGLGALFTFEESQGTSIAEATGSLTGNTLSGGVTVVEPVVNLAFLGAPFPLQALPGGNLTASVTGYSVSPAPAAGYPDTDGELLINGTGPARVWGTPWLESMEIEGAGLLLWENTSPEITLTFSAPVRVDLVTLYLANSGGAGGVGMPASIQVSVPGGTPFSKTIVPDSDPGDLQPASVAPTGMISDTLVIQLIRGAHNVALAEIEISGIVMQSQTIDFPTVSPVPFMEPVTLAATASSGLPVSYAVVSGPAVLDGNTLTFTAAGTVEVAASQAGNDLYLPAEAVTQSFAVLKAAQEVVFTQTISSQLATGTVTLDGVATASSGLPVNYAVVSGPAVVEDNTLTFTAAGTVTLAASQAGNDSFLPAEAVTQSFTVLKAAQEVVFTQAISPASVMEGIVLSATASSGLPVSYAVVSGPAVVDGNELSFTATGTVVVAASQAGDDLFLPAEPVSRTIEVVRVPQEISNFPQIPPVPVEDVVTLVASADSGLPVSFEVVSGPGVLEGDDALRITGPGVVLVVARQAGDALWAAAPDRLQAIEVQDGLLLLQPGEGMTAGLAFGAAPGRVELDGGFSLAGRSFTVEGWIWLKDISGDRSVLGQPGPSDVLHLNIRDGHLHLGFWSDDLTGDTVLPVNEWVHIAFTYDAETRTQRVYVNGENDGSRIADAPFSENALPLQIGGGFSMSGSSFNGRILELRIWDHARPGPVLSAGRFATPPSNAPGLEALFTFEMSGGTAVPDATGQLANAVLTGDVAVVEPVIGLDFLGFTFPLQSLPQGTLRPYMSGYALSDAPLPTYADAHGIVLTNGFGPTLVWGAPWLDPLQKPLGSILVWEEDDPAITLSLTGRAQVDAVTLHLANSGGAASVDLPDTIHLSTPGGFAASIPVTAGAETGSLQAVRIEGLGLITEALTVSLQGSPGGRIALAEVQLDGAPLRIGDPAPTDPAPRLARLFHGFDPALNNREVLNLDLEVVPGEAQFLFQRGAERLGVEAVSEWSPDLQDWYPMPHEIHPDGRGMARLALGAGETRAFFRLRYVAPPAPGLVQAPAGAVFEEDADARTFPPGFLFGGGVSPESADGIEVIALNDQAGLVGSTLAFAYGVTLRMNADGSGELFAPVSMPGGAVVDEVITYTVVNALGESVRRSFAFTVNGINNPPTIEPIALSHASAVEPAGTAYRYFEGDFPTEASLLAAEPTATGRQPTFSLAPAADATGGFGLEMTGELFVPAPGPYTFFLMGNNTAVLDVGGTRVIAHDDTERSGTVELTAGTHSVRVLYFDTTEPAAALTVEYVGPGFLREAIPAEAFPRLTAIPLDPLAGASDPDEDDVLAISHIADQLLTLSTPVQLASGAEVQLNGDGTLTYVPAPGRTVFHGATDTDSFTYTVTDSGGLSATAAASLDLARFNTAPVSPGSFTLQPDGQNRALILTTDVVNEIVGDGLRITHVNGSPIVGGDVRSLPSKAILSHSGDPLGLYYDGEHAFFRTLSQQIGSDAFTLTLTDAAGATADVDVTATLPLALTCSIKYTDSRFPSGAHLAGNVAQLWSQYPFPVEAVTYITDRQTGLHYGHHERTLQPFQTQHIPFDLPTGIDLEGQHFFDRFDLELDTLTGDPILYGFDSGEFQVERLYSTASESFFSVTGAMSPHWPMEITIASGTFPYKSGIYRISTQYGGIIQVFRFGILTRGASAQKGILEPTFASNIIVTGICRTRDISRFTVENRNNEPVPLTVGSGEHSFTVPAHQTITINVTYEPKVWFHVIDTPLGLFDSREITCPVEIDFTVESLCAGGINTFTRVVNNDTENAYTVRVESVEFPSIRSDPVTIGNQAEAFIGMEPQGQNLGGTEGRVVLILPDREEVVETFIFSDNDC